MVVYHNSQHTFHVIFVLFSVDFWVRMIGLSSSITTFNFHKLWPILFTPFGRSSIDFHKMLQRNSFGSTNLELLSYLSMEFLPFFHNIKQRWYFYWINLSDLWKLINSHRYFKPSNKKQYWLWRIWLLEAFWSLMRWMRHMT